MYNNETCLCHYSVLGMKWGHRKQRSTLGGRHMRAAKTNPKVKRGLSDTQKKVLKGAAITAGTILATYGAYKIGKLASKKSNDMVISYYTKYYNTTLNQADILAKQGYHGQANMMREEAKRMLEKPWTNKKEAFSLKNKASILLKRAPQGFY